MLHSYFLYLCYKQTAKVQKFCSKKKNLESIGQRLLLEGNWSSVFLDRTKMQVWVWEQKAHLSLCFAFGFRLCLTFEISKLLGSSVKFTATLGRRRQRLISPPLTFNLDQRSVFPCFSRTHTHASRERWSTTV